MSESIQEQGGGRPKGSLSRLDGAMSVLLLTALAYSLAFGYECGYLEFFGVSANFAEVNLRSLLICAVVVVYVAILVLVMVDVLLRLLPQNSSPRLRLGSQLLVILFAAVALGLYVFGVPWLAWALLGLLSVMLAVKLFGIPMFRSQRGNLAAVEAIMTRLPWESAPTEQGLLRWIGRLDERTLLLVVFAIGSPFFAYALGRQDAREQVNFLVPKNEPSCAVLRDRSDGLLCATFREQRYPHYVCGEYRFLKIEGAVLQLKQVGPLHGIEWEYRWTSIFPIRMNAASARANCAAGPE